jgi:hypothetical protein
MHWRGSVLTREPILDAPPVASGREAQPARTPAALLLRVAAASYIGTLAAWTAGILLLGAVRHGADAFRPDGGAEVAVHGLAQRGPLK